MKIKILGCGGSGGVPLIGGKEGRGFWGNCNPDNPKNRRTRASIYIEEMSERLLIDTSPDLREQFLHNNLTVVDHVLFTHAHADHMHGIDDLRAVNFNAQKVLQGYADTVCAEHLKRMFPYIFDNHPKFPLQTFYKPAVDLNIFKPYEDFKVGSINIRPFTQGHGFVETIGYRIDNMAYSTDVINFPKKSESYLFDLDLWIIDCLQIKPHNTHAHLEQTLDWITKYKPKKAILTHMNHELDYDALVKILPNNVEPAFDGMVVECP